MPPPAVWIIAAATLDLELTADEIESLDQLYRPRDVVNDYVPTPLPRHLGGVLTD